MGLRERLSFYLEDMETLPGRVINLSITGLVLISSAIFVAETYSLPPAVAQQLDRLENGILIIFVVEYLLRLWCADHRLQHLLSLFAIVDLVAILPFLLGAANVGFLRIFRWFRILRLLRFIGGNTIFGYVSQEDGAIFTRIIFTVVAIVFVYSGLIYQVEHPINGKAFNTFLDAIYFSVSTITTAGFGDITPSSQMGRLLTVLMLLTGVVLIPWQLGDLIKQLVKTADQRVVECSDCGLALHAADAYCCRICGTRLPSGEDEGVRG
jgi:voltage-gated potassium channel